MSSPVCRIHYRNAVAECSECGGGLCPDCHAEAANHGGRCRVCLAAKHDWEDLERVRRESRLALRRAGVAVRRHAGDPVVLWRGPLRLALPFAGGVLTVVAAGVLGAELKLQWNVDMALSALALALLAGVATRLVFGGVSQAAGLTATIVYALAVICAEWFAGGGSSARSVAYVSRASEWIPGHAPAAVACYLVAGALAYAAARGRRPV